ncbi:PREDICTED: probable tRNA pseudouridine synthase 2 [Nicrophorus vespilloides]|uniref:Probable tRNA pseudouridine synthase 2 n=1 Tax=Nicrophorus vespilloides TaxID=110193 RepID=A0ABM1M9G6_NICVS|nr:PREDICTED: probable tRNA pseudouridine synthase 2 [Nicrophorus vespilloides]
MLTTDAALLWRTLKGVICIYKPADTKLSHVRTTIINKLCADLNQLDCRPPIDHVVVEPDEKDCFDVKVVPNLADHPMVVGPRYQANDLPCSWSNFLGTSTSGVLILGLGRRGTSLAKNIRENYPTRAYRIKGVFGQSTDNNYKDGKVVERSTFWHVKLSRLERLLANMQASHQRKMFEMSGVDMQSQTAYDLAIKGPIRPANSKLPLIYGLKCVHFQPPNFTIEVQCVNEYEMYLKTLIHEIGTSLHSTAHCTGLQCIRHSHFTLDDAFLRRHWDLRHLMANMERCNKIISEHGSIVRQENATLQRVQQ